MRENRLSGSEGGGPEPKAGLPTPIPTINCVSYVDRYWVSINSLPFRVIDEPDAYCPVVPSAVVTARPPLEDRL
jgi:hypothetical protein